MHKCSRAERAEADTHVYEYECNSAAYVRDRLASYVASYAIARTQFCELAAASIAGLALE